MLLLNKKDIQSIFTMKDAIEADKLAFSMFNLDKCKSPIRTNFNSENANGSILYMPGYIKDLGVSGLKIVSVFPENGKYNLPSTPGTVLLVDDKTGMVVCLLDGTYVTELRTGAASGAAIDILAIKDSKIGALIGTGGQAESQLEAMLCARPSIEEVRVFSRNDEKRDRFVDAMQKKFNNVKIISSKSSNEAIKDADVIITVTTSTQAVIDGDYVKKGATVCGVGSYMPNMHEFDEKTIKKADKIYFDSKEAVLSEAGCIITPLNNGTICEKDFTGDLGQVINGDLVSRESDDEIIVFKTVGISVQDLVTSKMIYNKAVENKIGYEW